MPGESLVVLTMAGKRLGATLRVDLPAHGADPLAFAEGVMSFLQGDSEADGALVIVYTQEDWEALTPPPRAALVRCVEAVLGAGALPLRGGWFVSRSGWRDYFCSDGGVLPMAGAPPRHRRAQRTQCRADLRRERLRRVGSGGGPACRSFDRRARRCVAGSAQGGRGRAGALRCLLLRPVDGGTPVPCHVCPVGRRPAAAGGLRRRGRTGGGGLPAGEHRIADRPGLPPRERLPGFGRGPRRRRTLRPARTRSGRRRSRRQPGWLHGVGAARGPHRRRPA
ncbi:hypothetical protein [Arthrobacter sp. NPDC092385]|uniref:hypothetical protein n=1 Tax=Arthrobacter sp. NPDC092385 TaxID=3363943 RepID=UPI003819B5B9